MAEDRSTTTKKTTPTKKSTSAKKATPATRSSSAKKTASARTTRSRRTSDSKQSAAGAGSGQLSAADVALSAAGQLMELTGRGAEGVTGVERTDDGWRVHVEVVELRRVPESTDLLATYEVTMTDSGTMSGYRRMKRYSRGSTTDG